MTKRSTPTGAGKSASLAEARNNGVTAMTEVTQDELAKELGFLPATAKGWRWTWQRCGRCEYRKCLTHLTNSDHLIPQGPSPTDVSFMRIAAQYAAGRRRVRRGQFERD